MGRADRTTKVKGMFVRPEQIAEIGKRHPELGRLRLVVTRAGEADVMTLEAECISPNDALQDQLAASLRAVTKLGGNVELVPIGALPNDGRVIGTNAERIATANQIGFVLAKDADSFGHQKISTAASSIRFLNRGCKLLRVMISVLPPRMLAARSFTSISSNRPSLPFS